MECLLYFCPFSDFDYILCRSLPLLALFLTDLPGDTSLLKQIGNATQMAMFLSHWQKLGVAEGSLGTKG